MEKSDFKVTKWEEKAIENETDLFPVHTVEVEYKISGILEGIAYLQYLLYYLEEDVDGQQAEARVSGFFHFKRIYKNREGTFTACENGTFEEGRLNINAQIVNATEQLKGLDGTYKYDFQGKSSELLLDFKLSDQD
ncbi:DUF3224 domain-containing protein [Oenococcus oeni]|uniref:PbsX family transcriptional regulator n=2 Tax=Oenococcus oeni TaxID=1247 RepID=D3LBI5_OENOE|nr:DUF3224 domain-containing protein [Oenococcus oeni]AWW98947.1 DUF3224 domain-containing protein [Oenococcus oeni]EFD87889.1 hypothetical protein AWRIB429_1715 [Oenococcus oeni AWRIB429]EJN92503.1 hypothetical protein AWRIB304_935 [Oenococcus oeni AWRIB304]EJO00276.1 hypothetical protein AWRIB419_974 [Oenococcus oeni AWRIB419]EJO00973.1 hypothetical protein AWRIB318_1133 [Oenococcus oeni AWRIB318]